VLRIISTSSGEGGGNEKPDDELKIVLEEIKEAKSKLAKYEAWFEKEEKSVTAEMVTMAQRALNLLREKEARLEASSAPSCATGVVRKHFLRKGGLSSGVSLLRLVHATWIVSKGKNLLESDVLESPPLLLLLMRAFFSSSKSVRPRGPP
jgi:hypothetical protein